MYGASRGGLSIETRPLQQSVSYGVDQTVGRFRISADNRDDHLIRAITFTNRGSVSGYDLRRLYLTRNSGEPLTTIAPALTRNTVRLIFEEPLLIEKNESIHLLLHADVRASRRKTIDFVIEELSDIEAKVIRGRQPAEQKR